MKSYGPPIAFQTATAARIGNLMATLDWAVGEGADAVELPEGFQQYPPDVFRDVDAKLRANPT